MSTTTPRLGLVLPGTNDFCQVSQLDANFSTLDTVAGLTVCTSTTRPSTPYQGQAIYETDTQRVLVSNGSTPASGSWEQKAFADFVCTSSTRPSAPFQGLTIFETDTKAQAVYTGSAWLYTSTVTCTSTTRPTTGLAPGVTIYQTDTGDVYVYNGSSWDWVAGTAQKWRVSSTSGTLSSIATGTDTAYSFATTNASSGVTVSLGTTGTTVGTSGTKVTINKAGLYLATASIRWSAAVGNFYAAIRHYNSSNVEVDRWGNGGTTSTGNPVNSVTGDFQCAAGDYLQLWVWQNSSGSVALASDNGGCRFSGRFVGA